MQPSFSAHIYIDSSSSIIAVHEQTGVATCLLCNSVLLENEVSFSSLTLPCNYVLEHCFVIICQLGMDTAIVSLVC